MSNTDGGEDPDVTRAKLKTLAQRAAPGGGIQVTDGNSWDPQGFAASGGQSVEERTPAPAPLAPTTAAPAGTHGKLADAWDGFIGHPESRAGLMQFAVNMLSGRGLGESLGGAAEAMGRNVAAQQAEEQEAEKEDLAERAQATKESEAASYGIMARKKSGQDQYYDRLAAQEDKQNRMAGAKAYSDWRKDPLDTEGYLAQVKRKYPQVQRKADLADPANAEAERYARSLITGERTGGAAPPQEFSPPAGAVPRNVNGHKVWYDPKTGQAIPGQFGG